MTDVGARLRALLGVAVLAAIAVAGWLAIQSVIHWIRYHEILSLPFRLFRVYFFLWFLGLAVLVLVLPDVIRTLVDWGPAALKAVRRFIDVFFSTP